MSTNYKGQVTIAKFLSVWLVKIISLQMKVIRDFFLSQNMQLKCLHSIISISSKNVSQCRSINRFLNTYSSLNPSNDG